jgi:transcriptional regulator with XRE-family HTH domain
VHPESITAAIGMRVEAERDRLRLGVIELAERLNITRQQVSRIERGGSAPSAQTLAALHAEGFDTVYILTGTRTAPTPAQMTTKTYLCLLAGVDARLEALTDLKDKSALYPATQHQVPQLEDSIAASAAARRWLVNNASQIVQDESTPPAEEAPRERPRPGPKRRRD